VKVNATFDGGSRRGPSPRNYDYSIHYVNAPWPFAVGQIPVPPRKPCPRDAFRPLTSSAGGTNILTLRLASVGALKFEAIYKKEKSKNEATGCRHN